MECLQRECPAGDHAANGNIEVEIREEKKIIRAIKMNTEHRSKLQKHFQKIETEPTTPPQNNK